MNKETIAKFAGLWGSLAPATLGSLVVMSYLYDLSFSYGLGKDVMSGNGLSDYFDNSVRWGFLILVMLGSCYFLPLSKDDGNKVENDGSVVGFSLRHFSKFCINFFRSLSNFFPSFVYGLVLIWMISGYVIYSPIDWVVWSFALVFLMAVFGRVGKFDLSKEFSLFFFVIFTMAVIVSIAGYSEGRNVLHHEKVRGFCSFKMEGGAVKSGWLVKSNSKFFFFINEKYELFMVSSGKLISYDCIKR